MDKTPDYMFGKIFEAIDTIKKTLDEDRDIRDANHKRIEEISEAIVQLSNDIKKLDSWKNGQQMFMHKTTEDIIALNIRVDKLKEELLPLKDDLTNRASKIKEVNSNRRDIGYKVVLVLILAFIGAIFINIVPVGHSFINLISHQ